MKRAPVTALLFLLGAWGCTAQQVGNQPDPSPTPTPASSAGTLTLVGPFSMAEGECVEYTVSVIDALGDPQPVVSSTDVAADAGGFGSFYTDNACTAGVSEVTLPAGNASITAWVQVTAPGRHDLTLTDPADDLATGTLNVSVDAMLIAAQDWSTFGHTFNNAAWTTIQSEASVPMRASVSVPATGDWYIEVRGRASVREPNGSVIAARLVETSSGLPLVVDHNLRNGNEGEFSTLGMAYVQNAPVNGATYTYEIELTANIGATHNVNPTFANVGPTGDQIPSGRSQIMAIVRPARQGVD